MGSAKNRNAFGAQAQTGALPAEQRLRKRSGVGAGEPLGGGVIGV